MKTITVIAAIMLVFPSLTACGSLSRSQEPSVGNQAEEAEIRSVVVGFGKRLQLVSLQSPNASQEIEAQYGGFVASTLLEAWMGDISQAPGRIVSSPWPDRIEITSMEELGDGVTERFCVLYDRREGGCAVYPVRPLVCRLLGHVEFMPCPFGRVPSVLPDGPAIMQRYAQLDLRTLAEWFAEEPPPKLARALRHREELSPRARCEGTEGDQGAH